MTGAPAAPDLRTAIEDWQNWLRGERRAALNTRTAYLGDLTRFLEFLMGHLGGRPTLASLGELRPADFRAWLAAQAARGVSRSTSARGLSVVRGFYRWLAKAGLVDNPAVAALKTPRVPRPVPKALTVEEARDLLDSVPELARAPWIGKRDAAVIALLYGCGLRIGEALSLARREAPEPEAGLPSAELPASACLASRIPYGMQVTPAKLRQIDRAEEALRALGYRQVRVRHHGDLARIEPSPSSFSSITTDLPDARRPVSNLPSASGLVSSSAELVLVAVWAAMFVFMNFILEPLGTTSSFGA